MSSHAQASSIGGIRRKATGRGRIFRGVAVTRAFSLRPDGSGALALGSRPDVSGTPALGPGRFGAVALALAALALSLALVFVAGAQAASYTAGAPLSAPGALTSGVAVDQSSHDVYVTSCGVEEGLACNGGTGAFREFSSAGAALACSLEGSPQHPSSVAVDPVTGEVDVLALVGSEAILTEAEIFVYGANCGALQHEFQVKTSGVEPIPEPVGDSSGGVIVPVGSGFEGCSLSGACSELGASPGSIGAALNASGNLYLATGSRLECNAAGISEGKLVEYGPDGKGGFTESGAFAGLDGSAGHGEVSAVTVDKKTGQVFVGRGCGETFRVERYRAGGAKLDEFGAGLFSTGSEFVYNELAVDESTGKVYATDSGHQEVQTFGYSGVAFVSLGVSVGGEGSVVCEVEGHEEPCASEYETGTEITLKAVDGVHSKFVGWSNVTGSAEPACKNQRTCTFTISAASTARANIFEHPSVLTVFKGGNGQGTVSSLVPGTGVVCGPACEEGRVIVEEGQTVELEASPVTGSVFAGWIGCRHLTATTCQVKLGASEAEATAVFLPESKEGKQGSTGAQGAVGAQGAAGAKGATGAKGEQGTGGAAGAQGAVGPAGAPGAAGSQGPKGAPGPAGKVTCTVKQQGKKAKVTCTVKYPTPAKSSRVHSTLRWLLLHQGHVVAHGAGRSGPRIHLGALRRGRYVLYLGASHNGTVIHVR